MVGGLHQLAISIFGVRVTYGFYLKCSGYQESTMIVQIVKEDFFFNSDDWSVSDYIFKYFEKMYGPHTINVFANCKNKTVKRFYLKYWNPGATGGDSFVYYCSGVNCWILLPPFFACKVLKQIQLCHARGILIITKWLSSLFWPMIWNKIIQSY